MKAAARLEPIFAVHHTNIMNDSHAQRAVENKVQ